MILLSPDAVDDIERLRSFLGPDNPDAARRELTLIWTAIDRLQEFPDMGMPTGDGGIRQIVIRLGASGYIVRYAFAPRGRKYSHHADLAWSRGANLMRTVGRISAASSAAFKKAGYAFG